MSGEASVSRCPTGERVRAILALLDGVWPTRRGWSSRCPVARHDDRSPSLSIAEGRSGRVLLYCFGGGTYAEIMAALEQRGLPRRSPVSHVAPPTRSPFAEALAIARRQSWFREDVRLTNALADTIRCRRRAVDGARRTATAAGDCEQTWGLLATAARVETDVHRLEAALA